MKQHPDMRLENRSPEVLLIRWPTLDERARYETEDHATPGKGIRRSLGFLFSCLTIATTSYPPPSQSIAILSNMAISVKLTTLAVSLLAHIAHSVDIAFVDGADCAGIGLYGTKSIPYLPCYDLSTFDPASSVHMRNMADDQVLHFFSDSSCQMALHSTGNSDDQCFTSPIGRFGSFQVSAPDTGMSVHERESSAADTTDVAPYAMKMSNYTEMGTFSVAKVDLGLSIFTLGLGLVGLGQAIDLYGAINTCVALKGPKPSAKDIFDCAIQPVSTICTIAGTALVHHAGKRALRRFQLSQGNVMDLRKRTEQIDGFNADFVHAIMNNTAADGDDIVHIGSAERSESRIL